MYFFKSCRIFKIKSLVILLIFSLVVIGSQAQTGLNFQGVARNSNNVILASQQISLRLSILQGTASGAAEYTETRKVTTNAQGLFTAVIGDVDAISTTGNFSSINWKNTPKFLKIEMDVAAGSSFVTIGTTQFQSVAYAQFAKTVDAENIVGIVPVEKGGTGVASITALKTALAIDKITLGLTNVDNTSDLLKPISTAIQTALEAKANTTTVNTSMALKANATDVTSSLTLKENNSNKSPADDLGGLATSDILFPTQKAVKTYVDGQINTGGVADGSILTRHIADGAITGTKLAGLIATTYGGTGVATSTANSFFAGPDGITGAPNFRAMVAADLPINATGYIQNATAQQASSNFNISDNGVIGKKLTINGFDLGVGGNGTVLSNIAIGSEALKVVAPNGFGVGGIENIAMGTTTLKANTSGASNTAIGHYALQLNTTGANNSAIGTMSLINSTTGSSNTSVGMNSSNNNTTGDANTAIGVSALYTNRSGSYNTAIGWGADVASNNLSNATAIGNGASVTASNTIQLGNGLVTLVNTSGAITATGFNGPLNGNATSATTATTATTAGDITATSNLTLTSLPNLGIIGTITSGVWSGTAINAGALAGTILNSAITGSSLTSVGTLTSATINGKVVVGASAPAASSAVLEASSTTQGFLPPRMTWAQRDAIITPASGLVVWCNNCGAVGELQVFSENASWTNLAGTTAAGVYTPTVGANYQGGKVAYILVPSDPGYDATTPHGLIAANSDQSTGIRWHNGSYSSVGVYGTAIGTGLANTNTIIASQGPTSISYAAGISRAYNGGGYTDWYLPSKDELYKLYLNRVAVGGFAYEYGFYWSSTEVFELNGYFASALNFYNGSRFENYKINNYYVRAVRSF